MDGIKSKFSLGRLVATQYALKQVPGDEIIKAIDRHRVGDWGEVDKEDHEANESALEEDARVFSIYRSANGVKFWIITEADRSVTTVLLPEDY